jgi:hypothetical protein
MGESMTFLNGLLALGAFACTIPLVIHLMHRSRFRVVKWGAMHLIESTASSKSKRILWKHVLLMLVRCMLPILIAFAMSRPLVRSWTAQGTGEPIALALILDDSLSMQAVNRDGKTRWNRALDHIGVIVSRLPKSSKVGLVLGGTPVETQSFENTNELVRSLTAWKQQPSRSGSFDPASSVRQAVAWLTKSDSARRQLLLVSDFSVSDWESDSLDIPGLEAFIGQQPIKPRIGCLPIEATNVPYDTGNLTVEQITVSPSLWIPNREGILTALIRNTSPQAKDRVRVRLDIDDVEQEQQEVDIPGNSAVQTRFRWLPKAPRDHLAKISLVSDDPLRDDDFSYAILHVEKPRRILIVDGELKYSTDQTETKFLNAALSPFAFSGTPRPDPFLCNVITRSDLADRPWASMDALILSNVPSLTEQQSRELRTWIEEGHGMILFAGDQVQPRNWNDLPAIRSGGIMPGKILDRTELPDRNRDEEEVSVDLSNVHFSAISSMPKSTFHSLADIRFQAFNRWQIDRTESTTPVVYLSNGDPWIIRSQLGKGSVLWVTTSCGDGDSNLPSRAAYVPLMQRLVGFVSAKESTVDRLAPGEVWNIGFPTKEGFEDADMQTLRVFDPSRNEHTLATHAWTETRQLGLYEAKWTLGNDSRSQFMEVSSMTQEGVRRDSNLHCLDPSAISKKLSSFRAEVFTDSVPFLSNIQTSWLGREVWQWFWFFAIVFFILEIWLEQSYLPRARGVPFRNSGRK